MVQEILGGHHWTHRQTDGQSDSNNHHTPHPPTSGGGGGIIKGSQSKDFKKYTQSQINQCEITVKVINSRGEYEAEHKTMEIQTYIHAFIIRKLRNY